MIHGQSSQRGILFADSSAPGDNAVYCCYQNGEITCLEGPADELRKLFKSEMNQDKSPRGERRKDIVSLISCLLMVAVVAGAVVLDGTPNVIAGALVFAVVGAFPLMSLSATCIHNLASPETFEQLKRNHGAEHAALACHRRHKKSPGATFTLERMRASSYIDPECGTVYMASILLWAAIAGVTLGFSAELGIAKAAGILVGALVLLVANIWFNPANPLKVFQLTMVARPTDRELALAAAGLQKLLEITDKR